MCAISASILDWLKPLSKIVGCSLLALAGTFFSIAELQAERVIFSIDPAQSFLDLEIDLFSNAMPAQSPGVSDTSTYGGLIAVDVDATGAPTSLEILGSDFRAAFTGDWLPGVGGGMSVAVPGPAAPANYGFIIPQGSFADDGLVAIRDISYGINQPPVPVSNGQFLSTDQLFQIRPGSTWALNIPKGLISPDEDLITEESIADDPDDPNDGDFNFPQGGSGQSSYIVTNSSVTLTIPIDLLRDRGDLQYISLGTLVATANLSSPITSDFDQDGDTDGNDFLLWQQGFGIQGTAVRGDGDGNGDGNVDDRDLAIWQSLEGFVAGLTPPAAVAGVPEPASGLLAGFAALVVTLGGTRRRQRNGLQK